MHHRSICRSKNAPKPNMELIQLVGLVRVEYHWSLNYERSTNNMFGCMSESLKHESCQSKTWFTTIVRDLVDLLPQWLFLFQLLLYLSIFVFNITKKSIKINKQRLNQYRGSKQTYYPFTLNGHDIALWGLFCFDGNRDGSHLGQSGQYFSMLL